MSSLHSGLPSTGNLFTGVVQITGCSEDISFGSLVPSNIPVILCHSELPCGRISMYDYLVQRDDELTFLVATPTSWMCTAPSFDHGLLPDLLELCAGTGGMGLGAAFAGGKVQVSVDNCELATQHLLANQHGQVLRMDLTDPQAPKLIHQACAGPIGTATMGFPCQPFSSQGWRQGITDSRFQVFVAGLRIIFQIQPQTAILECVIPARQEAEVQRLLQELAALMHWDVLQVNLHLHDRWPCRRSRWWILLLPSSWNCFGLSPWPSCSQYATVGDIFRHWGIWSHEDELALQLHAFELEAYLDPRHGTDKRLLEMADIANTILHSYANALQGCPCRCRLTSFSAASLVTSGLRGFFICSRLHNNPRFLHPREAAHLLGFPATVVFPHTPRESLCLLGLSASPLQMLWVYSTLKCNASHALRQDPSPAPEFWLHHYCQELIGHSAHHFACDNPPLVRHFRLVEDDGTELVIASPLSTTAAQLLQAHRIVLGWNQAVGLSRDGHSLALDQPLDSGSYGLHVLPGPSTRSHPPSRLVIPLHHQHEHHLVILCGGQFLFEALADLGIHSVNFLVDDNGKLYGADYRVWRSLRLTTLDPASWPPRLTTGIQAAGLASSRLGLNDQQIWQALSSIVHSHPLANFHLVHPCHAAYLLGDLTFAQIAHLGLPQSRLPLSCHGICCIFAAAGHWALLFGVLLDFHITWIYSDGLPGHLRQPALNLAHQLTGAFGLHFMDFQELHWILQLAPHTCGTVALFHLCGHLGLCGVLTEDMILGLHQRLLHSSASPSLVIGLGPQTAETQLAALLTSKGVPWTVVSERATAAISKLGHTAVVNALQQANPWGALKSLASKPGKNFQFVTKDELQAYIATKAADKHGAQISTRKKQSKKPAATQADLHLDPASLSLLPGHFVDQDLDDVEQITLDKVTADAQGIAICDLAQALPYIKEARKISSASLALLITQEVPTELREQADLCSLRFPATYLPTQDPLLVQGSLLQLGDVPVQRKALEEPMNALEVSDTAVLKLQVYRDELGLSWAQFITSPIKQIILLVPKLRMCQNPRCDFRCGHFHAAIEDVFDQVIHEIWSRRFQSLEGRVQPPDQAFVFQAFLRVASSALEEVLPLAIEGIYFEPRCEVTKAADPNYAVVWIPGATRESASHKLKTIPHGLGLVRLKQRYGIRVKASHEELVYTELRPKNPYVKTTVTKVWRVHPLPHGLPRAQVAKLLGEWGWSAKPLQPSRGTSDGGAWEIGSSSNPPQPVLPAFGRDVLINLLKDKNQTEKQKTIIAPKRAQDHLRAKPAAPSSSTSDPWLVPHSDPWGKFVATGSASSQPKHYDVLAKQLKDDLQVTFQAQLQAGSESAATASSGFDQRIKQMEVGLTELHAHNKQVTSWMKDAGQKIAAQDEQLQQVQQGLQQQQADLVAVRSEVHSSAATLHQAMQVNFSTMKQEIVTDMAASLDHQMSRFETLLTAKKPRQE
eukprot:s825_g18.t1